MASKALEVIGRINKILEEVKDAVTDKTLQVADLEDADRKVLKDEVFLKRKADRKVIAEEEIREMKYDAETSVLAEFSALRNAISDYIFSVPNSAIMSILNAFSQVEISPTEAQILTDYVNASGSYICNRICSDICEKNGLENENFHDAESLFSLCDQAENEAVNFVTNYAGDLTNNHVLSKDLGLQFFEDDWSVAMMAEYFSREDTRLKELESALASQTVRLQLTPKMKERVSELFEDCETDDQKVEIINKLAEQKSSLLPKVRLYDERLYLQSQLGRTQKKAERIKQEVKELKEKEAKLDRLIAESNSALAES